MARLTRPGEADAARKERIQAIFGGRTVVCEPVSEKSIAKRVASFFRTLNPFKPKAARIIAKLGKLTVTPTLNKSVSAWLIGKLDSRGMKAWSHAEKSNPDGAKTFVEFLDRLGETAAAENPAFRQHVDVLLRQLSKSPALLDQSFAIATSATGTGSNDLTRVFNQLLLASVSHDIDAVDKLGRSRRLINVS